MNTETKFLILSLALGLLLILPLKTDAVSESSVTVNLSPESPAPAENTTITLVSYSSNLDNVLISWFVSGKKIISGIGEKSFSLQAPAAGSQVTVKAVLALPDGQLEKSIIIRPAAMVLLWQAEDSYVPPFYRGKALPVLGSEIKVVAMPEIRTGTGQVSPKNLTYSWKRNYSNEVDTSGYGKSSFIYTNDYLESSDNVSVSAGTIDGQSNSTASISVGSFPTKILFYKYDKTLGTLWERSLEDGYKVTGENILIAEPYFISPKQIQSPDLVWNWSINDILLTLLSPRKNLIPLRAENGTSGTSLLRLDIENQTEIFGGASRTLEVEF